MLIFIRTVCILAVLCLSNAVDPVGPPKLVASNEKEEDVKTERNLQTTYTATFTALIGMAANGCPSQRPSFDVICVSSQLTILEEVGTSCSTEGSGRAICTSLNDGSSMAVLFECSGTTRTAISASVSSDSASDECAGRTELVVAGYLWQVCAASDTTQRFSANCVLGAVAIDEDGDPVCFGTDVCASSNSCSMTYPKIRLEIPGINLLQSCVVTPSSLGPDDSTGSGSEATANPRSPGGGAGSPDSSGSFSRIAKAHKTIVRCGFFVAVASLAYW